MAGHKVGKAVLGFNLRDSRSVEERINRINASRICNLSRQLCRINSTDAQSYFLKHCQAGPIVRYDINHETSAIQSTARGRPSRILPKVLYKTCTDSAQVRIVR